MFAKLGLLLLLLLPGIAQAGLRLDLYAIADESAMSSPDQSISGFGFPGFGASLGVGLGHAFDLGVDLMYLKRKFSLGQETITTPDLVLAVTPHYWITHGLGALAGVYYGYQGIGTASDSIQGDQSNAGAPPDYGFAAGLAFRIPFFFKSHLLVEGRYHYGMANISQTNGVTRNRDILGLVGLEF